jgi:transcriptional regulator with XRE-family HTH domain
MAKKHIRDDAALKRLGKKIKKLREDAETSQAQLAFEIGISRYHLMRLEKGVHDPKYSTLLAIAKALDVDIKDLL